MAELEFLEDPAAFLRRRGSTWRRSPCVGTVVATVAETPTARTRPASSAGRAVPLVGRRPRRRRRGGRGGDADRAVRAVPAVPAADAGRGGGRGLARTLHDAASRSAGSTARCRRPGRSRTSWRGWPGARPRSPCTPGCIELGELCHRRPPPARLRPRDRTRSELALEWFEAFAPRRRRAGRPTAGRRCTRWPRPRRHAAADRRQRTGSGCGRRRRPGAPDRRQRAGLRRRPDRPGLHARGSTGAAGTPAPRSRPGLAAAPRRRRPRLPVHRPGQPDLEPALRGARLPAGGRHGRICWSGDRSPNRLGGPR